MNSDFKRLAIFASGNGTNAESIMRHFESHDSVKVALVVCNNPKAGVIERAKKFNVPVFLIEKNG